MFKLRHIGIVVHDLEKSLEFYEDLLELDIKNQMIEEGKFISTILGNKVKVKTCKLTENIELLEYLEGRHKNHIAFTTHNLDREYKLLKGLGIEFISEPQISPDRRAKVVFCYDPEGNLIELVEDLVE